MKPARLFPILCLCLTAGVAWGQTAPDPGTLPDEEDVPEVEEEWDFSKGRGVDPLVLERLNIMVPVNGRPHDGLSYRLYGERSAEKGTPLIGLFESKRVTRMDETHLLFEGAVYSFFDDPKDPDAVTRTVTFEDAVYNLQDRLIFSNRPLVIQDEKTRLQSGGVLYDLTTGLAVYTGGVELYLDTGTPEAPVAAQKEPAAAPAAPGNAAAPVAPAPKSPSRPAAPTGGKPSPAPPKPAPGRP